MSRTNYSRMSTQKFEKESKPTEPTPVEEVVDDDCAACKIDLEEGAVTEIPVSVGKVVNCEMLNVRANPNRTAKVLAIIGKGITVDVFTTESTNDWYKVNTSEGTIGYCMKEYIKLV